MLTRSLAFGALTLFGCASLPDLPPETAASRISSSDGYKAEACLMAQDYVTFLNAIDLEQPQNLVPIAAPSLDHTIATFAHHPEVTCRVKSGRYFYDVNGKAIYEIAAAIKELQSLAAHLVQEGVAFSACDGCDLPDVPLSNGLLLEFFRRDHFRAVKTAHDRAFRKGCVNEPEKTSRAHAHHTARTGVQNPGYEAHGSCDEALRAILLENAGRCGRYESMPYLICPNGIWDTTNEPAKPVHYLEEGYQRIDSFKGGFYLTLADGVDVYWRTGPMVLEHEFVPGANAKLVDVEGNGLTDLQAGDLLILSRNDRTGVRTSVSNYNSVVVAQAAADRAALAEEQIRRLPLRELERLLTTSHVNHPELLQLAAEKSRAWWQSVQEAATLEKAQVFWHARLWNELAGNAEFPTDYWDAKVKTVAPVNMNARIAAVKEYRRKEQAQAVFDGCNALRTEMKAILVDLEATAQAAKAASKAVGPAWEQYRSLPMPVDDLLQARETAKRNEQAMESLLSGVCL